MQPRVQVETWDRVYQSPGASTSTSTSTSGTSTPTLGRSTPSRLLQWAIQVVGEVHLARWRCRGCWARSGG